MQYNKNGLYYDPNLVTNHNSGFGCLERGSRVNINFTQYVEKGFHLCLPQNNPDYLKILEKIHKNNPLVKYLTSESFTPNFFEKIFGIKPKSLTFRNCHGCTIATDDFICPICNTVNNDEKFYKYAHRIDPNISDSDTTYITHTSYLAIKNSVSLVCQMALDVSKKLIYNAFAVVRPPGHHASNDKSEGFCLVNNIAICAEYALTLGFNRIFIFDFDAHHGNGTQKIFYSTNKVFYSSMHTIEAYPKTGLVEEIGIYDGEGYNLNVIVTKGIATPEYLDIYRSKILPKISIYNPDLILVSAGFDGLQSDPMQIMNLTPECYGDIVKSLVSLNIPLCMVLEGGYNVSDLEKCIDVCLNELSND